MAYEINNDTEFLEITHDQLPQKTEETIDGMVIGIEILYNDSFDIYTAQFYDDQDNFIGSGKLTYGEDLLKTLAPLYGLKTRIIPLDVARERGGQAVGNPRVSIDNFGKSVYLVVFRG